MFVLFECSASSKMIAAQIGPWIYSKIQFLLILINRGLKRLFSSYSICALLFELNLLFNNVTFIQ